MTFHLPMIHQFFRSKGLIICALALFFTQAFVTDLQAQNERKMLSKARANLDEGDYKKAKEQYLKLLELYPNDVLYNYETALAYFESPIEKGKAVGFLLTALNNSNAGDTIPDIYYYLGRTYQYKGDFVKAIQAYKRFERLNREENGKDDLTKDVTRYIEMCENGKQYFENNRKYVVVENLGPSINSEYPEYAPVIKDDESVVIFTSRRPDSYGGELYDDGKYYEDIYFSRFLEAAWSNASNLDSAGQFINSLVNTPLHDAAITYSANEKKLFIYRDNDIWISEYIDNSWSTPLKLKGRVNSEKGREPSVFLGATETTLLVVSDKKDGFGGLDIYKSSKLSDNSWGPLENIGPTINTKYDEDAPFLTPDGNTLYFSSKGHTSIGGYDVFKSQWIDDSWTEPENVGVPINTAGEEIYFITNSEGSVGYYASSRSGGYGDMDIYRITLECKMIARTEIRGLVVSEETKAPTSATITVTDMISDKVVGVYYADSTTGKYSMELPTERRYNFQIEAANHEVQEGNFSVPKQCDYYSLYQEMRIENLRDSSENIYAQRLQMRNAFFDIEREVKERFGPIAQSDNEQIEQVKIDSLSTELVEVIETSKDIEIPTDKYIKTTDERILDEEIAIKMGLIEPGYLNLVRIGDKALKERRYVDAKQNYIAAIQIAEEKEYPKEQIEVIDELLGEASFEGADGSYLSLLSDADRDVSERNFLEAREKYIRALRANPDASYPRERVSEIDNTLLEVAESEGKQEYIYTSLIDFADKAMTKRYFDEARQEYVVASQISPSENYPKDQITVIDGVLAEQGVSGGDGTYIGLILEADKQMQDKKYMEARQNYLTALGANPGARYPTKKVAEIDVILLAGAENGEEDATYMTLIKAADTDRDDQRIKQAKSNYELALKVKPEEAYPKEQIELMEALLANRVVTAKNGAYLALLAEADQAMKNKDFVKAREKYIAALRADPNAEYPNGKIAEINQILKEIAKEEGKNEVIYTDLIAVADKAMSDRFFDDAMSSYQLANEIKPNEAYAQDQITALEKQGVTAEDGTYLALLAEADRALREKNFMEAREKYLAALRADPNAEYPNGKIAEINQILKEIAKEEGKNEVIYTDLIAVADKAMSDRFFDDAMSSYQLANEIKPNEAYAQDQITALEKQGVTAEDGTYLALLAEADRALREKNFMEAREKYLAALRADPNAEYPNGKIAEINQILKEIAKEEGKNEVIYTDLIAVADKAMSDKFFDDAMSSYQLANEIKPNEAYAQDQITVLEKQGVTAEDGTYLALLAEADKAMKDKNFMEARQKYIAALRANPNADYPQGKVAELNDILREIAEENGQKKNEIYTGLIQVADKDKDDKFLDDAMKSYQLANEINPKEAHAKNQIAALEKQGVTAEDGTYIALVAEADKAMKDKNFMEARQKYIAALRANPNADYPQGKVAELNDILREMAQENGQKKNEIYTGLIQVADKDKDDKFLDDAMKSYQLANEIKPNEAHAQDQMVALEKQGVTAEDGTYIALVAEADKAMKDKNFMEARQKYIAALRANPNADYPQGKVAELNDILREIAEENGQKKNEIYTGLIQVADKDMDDKFLDDAMKSYQLANEINPKEAHAKNQIAALEKQGVTAEDGTYIALVAEADKAMKDKNFMEARQKYIAALRANPNADYPQGKVAELNNILREIAEENGQKKNEIYTGLIQVADKDMDDKFLDDAMKSYQLANEIKPNEAYAQDQMTALNSSGNLMEGNYDALIAAADAAMKEEQYVAARQEYLAALKADPNASYAQGKVAELNGILEDVAKEDGKEQSIYTSLITVADKAMDNKFFDEALSTYQLASKIKSDETYAKEQIALIEHVQSDQGVVADNQPDKGIGNYNALVKIGDGELDANKLMDARANYIKAIRANPGESYAKNKVATIDGMLAENARSGNSQQTYLDLIKAADLSMDNKFYGEARKVYALAADIQQEKRYPKEQIAVIDALLAEQGFTAEDGTYVALLAEANQQFRDKKLLDARANYIKALHANPTDSYPKNKIDGIDSMLKDLANKENKQQEIYDALIAGADEAMNENQLIDARDQYSLASDILASEQYPKDQVALIDGLYAKRGVSSDADAYQNKLAQADKQLANDQYLEARDNYFEALRANPGASYPKEKVEEISNILLAQAQKANANEKSSMYDALVKSADAAMKASNYNEARNDYNLASNLQEQEQYPKDQIAAIDGLLSQKEVSGGNDAYQRHIKAGDGKMTAQSYLNARDEYMSAIRIQPAAIYPQQRIKEINDLLSEMAEEGAADDIYAALVKKADQALNENFLNEARQDYELAKSIQSNEKYPQDQIALIDDILAEKGVSVTNGTYLSALAEADRNQHNKNYLNARDQYAQALRKNPSSSYANEKLAEMNGLLKQQATANQDGDKDAIYKALMASGNEAMEAGYYNEARNTYSLASDVKSAEQYPKNQMAAIDALLAQKGAKDETGDYIGMIETANKQLANKDLLGARESYTNALRMQPGDDVAENKISGIDNQLKKMAQEDGNKAEAIYQELVGNADGAMRDGYYDEAKSTYALANSIQSSADYPEDQIAVIDGVNAKRAVSAGNAEYNALMAQADASKDNGEYLKAREQYVAALRTNPGTKAPRENVAEIDVLLKQEGKDATKAQDIYAALVAKADQAMKEEFYGEAREQYVLANELKNQEKYPTDQIAAIDQLLADKGIESKEGDYLGYIALADQALDKQQYETARENYQSAANVQRAESYPTGQLAELNRLLSKSDQSGNDADNAKYLSAIADGDKAFNVADFANAKKHYQDAIAAKPSEQYPKAKLVQLTALEKEMNAADGSKTYDQLLAEARAAMEAGDYDLARKLLEQAMAMNSDNQSALDLLAQVEAAEAGASGTVANANNMYESRISEADAALANSFYLEAKKKYQEAAGIKPSEKYPTDQLAAVDKLIAARQTNGASAGEMVVFKNILFDFDKSNLRDASEKELNKLYNYLNNNPEQTVRIDGHTDWIGTEEYNKALSKKRADQAAGYLEKSGTADDRIEVRALGESKPVVPNAKPDGTDNPEGRQLNRRAEFKIGTRESAQTVIMKF